MEIHGVILFQKWYLFIISFLLYMVLSYVIILFEFDTMWLPFDQKIHITHKKKKHHHRQVTHHVSIPKLVLPDPYNRGTWIMASEAKSCRQERGHISTPGHRGCMGCLKWNCFGWFVFFLPPGAHRKMVTDKNYVEKLTAMIYGKEMMPKWPSWYWNHDGSLFQDLGNRNSRYSTHHLWASSLHTHTFDAERGTTCNHTGPASKVLRKRNCM